MDHIELEGIWMDMLESGDLVIETIKPKQLGCYSALRICPPIAFI